MNSALRLAREYGISIQFADLGDWGVDELRSEYDPSGPTIRINSRVAEQLTPFELGEFVCFVIGHELYHHRETIGEVPRLPERKDREIAANEFARKLIERM
ncbi:MAG: hypothetical protein KGN02_13195 [bacterium]|nr:hypothetical protein [bacterium]